MEINLIETDIDPKAVFNAAIHRSITPEAESYFNTNFQNFYNKINQYSEVFAGKIQRAHDYFTVNPDIQIAKELVTEHGRIVNDEMIHRVQPDTIGRAGYVMRRYIMAEPTIFNRYQNNRISGYEDNWSNTEPAITDPKDRDDYMEIMDGMLQYDEEGDGYIERYYGSEIKILTTTEKMSVIDAWEKSLNMIADGTDPTSENGDPL